MCTGGVQGKAGCLLLVLSIYSLETGSLTGSEAHHFMHASSKDSSVCLSTLSSQAQTEQNDGDLNFVFAQQVFLPTGPSPEPFMKQ